MEEEDNFKCNLCTKRYRYEGTLKTHVMVEHCKTNSYNCNQCEYQRSPVVKTQTFKEPSKEIEKDRGPEKLQMECNQSENSPSKKTANPLIEETYFNCDQCDTLFKSFAVLKRHLLVHRKKYSRTCRKTLDNFQARLTELMEN